MILRGKYNGAKLYTEDAGTEYGLQSTDYGRRKIDMDVEDLDIYKKSYELMLRIHKDSLKYPKIEQYSGIADQIRRSSKSITANIVEGFGKQRFYRDEFKRMLVYSVGSCDETILWIKTSYDLNYINKSKRDYYIREYKILVRKISKFISNMREK